jgi:hypothetical protein
MWKGAADLVRREIDIQIIESILKQLNGDDLASIRE